MRVISLSEFQCMHTSHSRMPLINVLSREAFEEGHIPGSENVPVAEDNFAETVEKMVGGRRLPLIIYCAGPECGASKKAANVLERTGFDQIYLFEGGMQEWREAGLPIDAGEPAQK